MKSKNHPCKFCHSVTAETGLCPTCASFFKRRAERHACEREPSDGYVVHIPRPEAGHVTHISIRTEVES